MKKLPKSIGIQGNKWIIKHKWNLRDDDGKCVDGLCDYENHDIYIDRILKEDEKYNTFLHELFHAVLHELKIGQTSLESDVEEIIVQGLADFIQETFNLRLKK